MPHAVRWPASCWPFCRCGSSCSASPSLLHGLWHRDFDLTNCSLPDAFLAMHVLTSAVTSTPSDACQRHRSYRHRPASWSGCRSAYPKRCRESVEDVACSAHNGGPCKLVLCHAASRVLHVQLTQVDRARGHLLNVDVLSPTTGKLTFVAPRTQQQNMSMVPHAPVVGWAASFDWPGSNPLAVKSWNTSTSNEGPDRHICLPTSLGASSRASNVAIKRTHS